MLAEGDRRGGDGLPAARVILGDVIVPFPGAVGIGLAAGMGDLDAGYGAVLLDGLDCGDEGLGQVVIPDPGAGGGNAPLGCHRSGLDDHQAGATAGLAGIVLVMPIVDPAVDGRVLTHGGYGNPVAQGDVLETERLE